MSSKLTYILGKLGAIISQIGFAYLKDIGGDRGDRAFIGRLFLILAFFMLTGVFSTLLIEETKGRSLEGELSFVFLPQALKSDDVRTIATQIYRVNRRMVLSQVAPAP